MVKDINKTKFSEETLLKLDIFKEYFREWFPVFIHNYTSQIYIYDLFAGSGKDVIGNLGSPLLLLQEAKGDDRKICKIEKLQKKKVQFIFNEINSIKQQTLQANIEQQIKQCLSNCNKETCIYTIQTLAQDFESIVNSNDFKQILKNSTIGKFILLDQYGVKAVNKNRFLELVNSPATDFIFFITSSTIKRFKNEESIQKYFEIQEINFDETKPNQCHQIIAEYYKSLIPNNKEYYLHHFTIKNDSNYYGLIFGTNHTLGMEKFLKVCWKHDKSAGESNCNIKSDYPANSLFDDENNSNKKQDVKAKLKQLILSNDIKNNIDGLKKSLALGCQPTLFVEAIKELKKETIPQIQIIGDFNEQATLIHKDVKKYEIKILP